MEKNILPFDISSLVSDLRQIVEKARCNVAAKANCELTMMYWHIGERINRDVLDNKRAAYGMEIVSEVASQLQMSFGSKGFELRNVRRMLQFASQYPNEEIVSALDAKIDTTLARIEEMLGIKNMKTE